MVNRTKINDKLERTLDDIFDPAMMRLVEAIADEKYPIEDISKLTITLCNAMESFSESINEMVEEGSKEVVVTVDQLSTLIAKELRRVKADDIIDLDGSINIKNQNCFQVAKRIIRQIP